MRKLTVFARKYAAGVTSTFWAYGPRLSLVMLQTKGQVLSVQAQERLGSFWLRGAALHTSSQQR